MALLEFRFPAARAAVRAACGLLAAGLVGSLACVHPRPREPRDLDNAVVFISMDLKGKLLKNFRADQVDFVKLTASGEFTDEYIPSNLTVEGNNGRRYIYLLDAMPGRYAVAIVRFPKLRGRYEVFVPTSSARATAVTVGRGDVAYIGHFEFRRTVKQTKTWKDRFHPKGDVLDAQLQRARITEEEKITAFKNAADHLEGTLWQERIDRRIEGFPTQRVTRTRRTHWYRFRRETIPYESTKWYQYQKTLDWGSPFEIKGGLEWRHPKDRARVAVLFYKTGSKGYRPYEKILEDLERQRRNADARPIEKIIFDSRPGSRLRYTTYYYPQGTLVGSEVEIFKTETLIVPSKEGIYEIHYRAREEYFEKYLDDYMRFRHYLIMIEESEFEPPR